MGKILRIGKDLDGCHQMFQHGVNAALKAAGENLRCNPNNYHFWRLWGWSDEKWMEFWEWGTEAGYIFNSAPLRGAVEANHALYDAGHKIHFITFRGFKNKPGLAEQVTEAWLDNVGFKYHSLTFSEDKTVIKTDVFVEDNIDNYHALNAAGTECYLITRPWNQGIKVERRVRSVAEFARIILEKY